ncbi:MAG: 2-polyprenyl-3-methyl-6-methoxy-1,4-benzoquinone monooxygenase [Sphingomonadales bacterium]|nr:MAG: 2-polyprenyl-3-methyl-6-methoxy-1,4-benzoquinone monooxygenase [Sphingomonadales bacterium]
MTAADITLRALFAPARAARPLPEPEIAPPAVVPQTDVAVQNDARRQAAALMRVNHAGEIAAQGLYQGQALVARNPKVRAALLEAGREETDHLAWTQQRLRELGSRTSLLDPLWYAGSFAIGVAAGLAGDRVSLGFIAETERQVEQHLEGHLDRLPTSDLRSRAIVEQMRSDEATHGRNALELGGDSLPMPIRRLMKATASVMTRTARWL